MVSPFSHSLSFLSHSLTLIYAMELLNKMNHLSVEFLRAWA